MKRNNASFNEMTVQEVAMGFIEVANETMCRPIRAITQVKICHSEYNPLSSESTVII